MIYKMLFALVAYIISKDFVEASLSVILHTSENISQRIYFLILCVVWALIFYLPV